MIKNFGLAIIAMLLSSVGALAQSTWRRSFNDGWTFSLNGGEAQEVRRPHDWAIKGDFDPANPSGTGGGALPGGMGVYRERFCTDKKHDKGMRYRLDFDGVYMNASVYVNGSLVGRRPYGYVSFGFDITPYLNPLGEYNDIEVRVDNTEQPNSRWYSGCGIYRNVWLTCSPAVHIAHDGVEVKYTLRNLHLDANGSKRAARRCMLTVNTTVAASVTSVLGFAVALVCEQYLAACVDRNGAEHLPFAQYLNSERLKDAVKYVTEHKGEFNIQEIIAQALKNGDKPEE